MKLGSLFDGSGGFPLAAKMVGIEPIWASEIEPFPIRVTTKRLPEVKHLGDVNLIDGAKIEPVDIITGGSPCQNLSVAGNRQGLGGEKSCLFYQIIRIVREMREATDNKYPRYLVWENVFGAFSSNDGDDFKAVLDEIVGVAYGEVSVPKPQEWSVAGEIVGDNFSVAWRTMDAQFWGVPQRRRRIYLVADFGGQSAGKILFESEDVFGNFRASREKGQDTSRSVEGGTGGASKNDYIAFASNQRNEVRDLKGRSGALSAEPGTHQQTFIAEKTKVYGISAYDSNAMKSKNPHSGIYEASTSRTLDCNGGNPGCNQGGMAVCEEVYSIQGSMIGREEKNGPQGNGVNKNVSFTLNTIDRHGVCVPSYGISKESFTSGKRSNFGFSVSEEKRPTIGTSGYGVCSSNCIVRKLTPKESARLQGFPDWWCDDLGTENPADEEMDFWRNVFETYARAMGISKRRSDVQIRKWLKDPYTDGAAYKMWGNGVALPCVVYVLGGIKKEYKNERN